MPSWNEHAKIPFTLSKAMVNKFFYKTSKHACASMSLFCLIVAINNCYGLFLLRFFFLYL